jgi:hypothetical protein
MRRAFGLTPRATHTSPTHSIVVSLPGASTRNLEVRLCRWCLRAAERERDQKQDTRPEKQAAIDALTS